MLVMVNAAIGAAGCSLDTWTLGEPQCSPSEGLLLADGRHASSGLTGPKAVVVTQGTMRNFVAFWFQ